MIPRVVNWASTWENHRAGSFDQYGWNLMLTVEVIGGGVARQGHQFSASIDSLFELNFTNHIY